MSRERVSSGGLTVLNGSAGVVRFAWTFSGSFANLDGELFAESAESRLQLLEPGGVPKIEQAIYLGQVAVEPLGRTASLVVTHRPIIGNLKNMS
jgi:hypothetical protein